MKLNQNQPRSSPVYIESGNILCQIKKIEAKVYLRINQNFDRIKFETVRKRSKNV